MKRKRILLAAGCAAAAALAARAGAPLRWTVETSRVAEARFEAYHGETLDLEATFNAFGKPLEPSSNAAATLYWQTNGMDSAWWSAPASVTGNVVRAAFTPAMDPGAKQVALFLGLSDGPSNLVYRAAARVAFRASPGAVPNEIPLPAKSIDFAQVSVANAPWLTTETDPTVPDWAKAATKPAYTAAEVNAYSKSETDAKVAAEESRAKAAESLLAPRSSLQSLASSVNDLSTTVDKKADKSALSGYATAAALNAETAARQSADAANSSDIELHVTDTANPHSVTAAQVGAYTTAETDAKIAAATPADYAEVKSKAESAVQTETDPTVPAWAKATSKPTYTAAEVGALASTVTHLSGDVPTSRTVNGKALSANVTLAASDVGAYSAEEGELWASWWSGDGFRVVVTNYDVAVTSEWARLPAAAFDYRPGGTGEAVRVWSETTRWDRHAADVDALTADIEAALDGKADLAWGATTPTGAASPDGFTWLDTPAVAVAGGLAWQKNVTSEGAVWILCSNGMVADLGNASAATNAYFRITDMVTGKTAFEVVSGDKVTVGANAASVYTWTADDGKTHIRVVYNVESETAPTLYAATSLAAGGATDWKQVGAEGCPASAAGWTGSSGAWTNALWRTAAAATDEVDQLYIAANYEKGGEAVIRNHAAVSMSELVLGGVTYTLGTATIDGHTVLTLTPASAANAASETGAASETED